MAPKDFGVEFFWDARTTLSRDSIVEPYVWHDWPAFVDQISAVVLGKFKELRVFWSQVEGTKAGGELIDFMHRNFEDTGNGWIPLKGCDLIQGNAAQLFWAGSTGFGPIGNKPGCEMLQLFTFDSSYLPELFRIIPSSLYLVREEYFLYGSSAFRARVSRYTGTVAAKGGLIYQPGVGQMQIRLPRTEIEAVRALYSEGIRLSPEKLRK